VLLLPRHLQIRLATEIANGVWGWVIGRGKRETMEREKVERLGTVERVRIIKEMVRKGRWLWVHGKGKRERVRQRSARSSQSLLMPRPPRTATATTNPR